MDLMTVVATGRWTEEPVSAHYDDGVLTVEAREGSDAWRTTSYGFVHDDAHALVVPLDDGTAMEVDFVLDYGEQFDQAGIMLRVNEANWIKAGVEVSDGVPQLGAVVTRGVSDWSVAPVPEWAGQVVTVRASRDGDAVTIRARSEGEDFRLVRLAPLDPHAPVQAGPFCCAPTRAGLTVRFLDVTVGEADESLHPED